MPKRANLVKSKFDRGSARHISTLGLRVEQNIQGAVIILECCFIKKVLHIINVKRAFSKLPQLSLLFTSSIILVHFLINLSAYFVGSLLSKVGIN